MEHVWICLINKIVGLLRKDKSAGNIVPLVLSIQKSIKVLAEFGSELFHCSYDDIIEAAKVELEDQDKEQNELNNSDCGLTEKGAWVFMGHDVLDGYNSDRTWLFRDYTGKHKTLQGLCSYITELLKEKKITLEIFDSMMTKINMRLGGRGGYIWPCTQEGAKERAKYCKEQADLLK